MNPKPPFRKLFTVHAAALTESGHLTDEAHVALEKALERAYKNKLTRSPTPTELIRLGQGDQERRYGPADLTHLLRRMLSWLALTILVGYVMMWLVRKFAG